MLVADDLPADDERYHYQEAYKKVYEEEVEGYLLCYCEEFVYVEELEYGV